MPAVSIGMPVFNGAGHVAAAIEAILAQSFADFELIISDNASTDATGAICRGFAARDTRIRYVRQAENIGAAANFDFVLGAATAPLFMWFAADDGCAPDFLAVVVACHARDPEVVLAITDIENVNVDGVVRGRTDLLRVRHDSAADWHKRRRLFFCNPMRWESFAIYGLYRRSVLDALPMRFGAGLKYATGVEIPLLAQVASRGKIVSAAGALKQYRWDPRSQYHAERDAMRAWQKLDNHVDISAALVRILWASELPMGEKIPLWVTVLWGLGFGSFRLAVWLVLAKLGLRRRGATPGE